jgi:hypothetical protein
LFYSQRTDPHLDYTEAGDCQDEGYTSFFVIFQKKNDTIEMAKHAAPKVSSRGYGKRCVKGNAKVMGWTDALIAIYIQPRRPNTKVVRKNDRMIFMPLLYRMLLNYDD